MANDAPNQRGPDAVTHQLPAGELPPGWTLLGGQYEIVRLIASGGFGITYLARDTLGRDVAVKECFPLGLAQRQAATHVVSATSAGTSEHFDTARAQFLREARMLAQLQHPNVVHVQTLFEENGTAYMAMDFIHGRDLHEEIVAAEAGMSPPRVLELARDLLGALDYIHGQGVLHRDIKPQNIRIDRFGVPMLIDFGAARAETQARSRMAGTFRVVTDGYSPHEFYVTGAPQGPHSDLYALAATLHHVITGKAPVAADERASAIATGQPDPYQPIAEAHPDQDGRLLHLIDRALRMTPADRPENAAAWLTLLADAPTTLIAPNEIVAEPAPARPSRLVPGLLLGALVATGAGAGIYMAQPAWLSPGMGEMMERMGQLEDSLAMAEAARAAAEVELGSLRTTLSEAEAELARLEAVDGDMVATMAELDEARAARDAAAEQVAMQESDLADLAATQAALEEAQSQRNAAETARAEAETARAEAEALLATAEADLATTAAALAAAQAEAAQLTQVQADLTEAELALYAATTRATELETELQQAMQGGSDTDTLRAQLQDLEGALTLMEAERDRLMAEIEAITASTESNAGELERLRDRITELTSENEALRTALARAEAALNEAANPATPAASTYWVEGPILRSPNGTMALLPRFSWDGSRMALADSTGGIALFDRATGSYEAHLARGIPDDIVRLGFSTRGNYLIATTPNGTLNRLYHIPTRREILRFDPTTVTTSTRAISHDEEFFTYTRDGPAGQVNVVVTRLTPLANAASAGATPSDRILTSVPGGTDIRISFAESENLITVITPDLVQVFQPDGRLLRTAGNRLGIAAAFSPLSGDRGLLALRSNGDVMIYDNPINQHVIAEIPARGRYTEYRLSGDRLHFLRADGRNWEVLDLLGGRVRGAGDIGQGYDEAEISVSSDGAMLLIGSVNGHPARLLDVDTGAEIQQFGDAAEGYFSFDGQHLVTGTEGEGQAQIWAVNLANPH